MALYGILQAAQVIKNAEFLLISAGAGMGVDSGLPDFRGSDGFWSKKTGFNFVELANPKWFEQDPSLAWGFYGYRHDLYQKTIPHDGYTFLKRWTTLKNQNYFILTSNVDGHFQKSGFHSDKIYECHGSLFRVQREKCNILMDFKVFDFHFEYNFRTKTIPRCASCGSVTRPNVLMFSDFEFNDSFCTKQRNRFDSWIKLIPSKSLAVIECGAGTTISTVRNLNERICLEKESKLIRINQDESECYFHFGISLSMGAKDALTQIDKLI